MSEHEVRKQVELADGVGYAIDGVISRAHEAHEMIWIGDAVREILAQFPAPESSPVELAELLLRAAAARGVAVAIQIPKP